ncbi:MAG: DCC1-like thiol-disulfide oxidoreductase family protein [Candidatus Marinimicrobia bacterium]|jgi:predicted DCC family thiol-disulfide oxidoreductase YuxK|nr:DCC1-like thiol-disulfide oxidoreductase family protein [Candidatus Neomarinimicrobiota bacterium]
MKPQLVIYYDGICFLCSNLVDFSIRHDHEKKIQYSPLQSNYAKRTLNMDETSDMDTVIVQQGDKVLQKSEAAFIILKFLNHPLQYLRFVIPRFLADKIYNLVSRKRYNWFGKKEECIFPINNSQFLID